MVSQLLRKKMKGLLMKKGTNSLTTLLGY